MRDPQEIQEMLQAPFPAKDIEWRIGRCGKTGDKIWAMCLAYVTNRAIMDRLDDVFGCLWWSNKFSAGPQGGIICGITAGGVTKWDGAENTQVESIKGGLSDSMKRAGVQWGIGRYLYNLEEGWAETNTRKISGGRRQPADKGGKYPQFWWAPPMLPDWALPHGEHAAPRVAPRPTGKKYKASDPTPAEQIISGIVGCQDIEELKKFYKGVEADINASPKKEQILTEFRIHQGTLEMRGQK